MNFKTATWRDAATEAYCARIFIEARIDLAAWGFDAGDTRPIDLTASSVNALAWACEATFKRYGFPMSKFNPIWLGTLGRSADVGALLEAELAAQAA